MNYDNDEDSLEFINRLLERLHQAGHDHQCSQNIHLVYVASGAQHVETQVNIGAHPDPPERREKGGGEKPAAESFNDDTPLSALFRETHHDELSKIIESWRPYLTMDETNVEPLAINTFQFALEQIRPVSIYMDLAHLINHDALRSPMSVLADYMFRHSNLSRSKNALYVQLKRYRKMCK